MCYGLNIRNFFEDGMPYTAKIGKKLFVHSCYFYYQLVKLMSPAVAAILLGPCKRRMGGKHGI